MCKYFFLLCLTLVPAFAAEKGFTSLFNGRDLTGWKANDNAETFTVKDGAIVTHGPSSHLFYVGDVQNHSFRDFELKVDVMTEPNSNGGIYIDSEFQQKGFPKKGFEVQVNNTYTVDPRKTGSLYEVQDNHDKVADDGKWFTEDIIQKGSTITVKVNGKQTVNWTQPDNWAGAKDWPLRHIDAGTIALQAHDPGSVVHYRNIRIKALK